MTATLAVPEADGRVPGAQPPDRWGRGVQALVLLACLAGFSLGFPTTVLVLSLAGVALIVLGLSQPSLGVYGALLLVTLDPFNKNEVIIGSFWRYHTINLVLGAVLVMQLPRLLQRRDPQTAFWLLLTMVMTVMLVQSPDVKAGIDELVAGLAPLSLVAVFARVGRDAATWRWAATSVGLLGALAGPLYYLRAPGADVNENALAFAFLAPLFVVTGVALFVPLTRRVRAQLLLLACSHIVWVFLTGSRGALLLALLALVMFGLGGADAGQRALLFLALGAAALVLVTQVTATQSNTLNRIDTLFSSEQSLSDRTSGRSVLIQAGWELFKDNPQGVGTGGYRAAVVVVEDADPQNRDAHAGWIKILAENGVIGGALLAGYVISFTFSGLRHGRQSRLLGVTTTIVLAVGLTTSQFGGKGLWVLPALATVLIHQRPAVRA